MKVTLLQMDIEWANPMANMHCAEQLLQEAPGSDLYVLPEMWSTGFVTDPGEMAEPEDGAALQWMCSMSRRLDAAVAGSVAVRTGDGTFRNRFYFVKPDGQIVSYDKHHLFSYGGENLHYKAGSERVIVEWRGVRFLLLVCYDLRFPIWSRNELGDNGYDCVLYVASWPNSRAVVWRSLLVARAIENQCYVCGVNRIGSDPKCRYSGGTSFIDAYGRRVSEAPDDTPSALTLRLEMAELEAFRKKFPVLKDRD